MGSLYSKGWCIVYVIDFLLILVFFRCRMGVIIFFFVIMRIICDNRNEVFSLGFGIKKEKF